MVEIGLLTLRKKDVIRSAAAQSVVDGECSTTFLDNLVDDGEIQRRVIEIRLVGGVRRENPGHVVRIETSS